MIVTTDAASSFTGVAEKIRSKKADYLLPIKKSNKAQAIALEKILVSNKFQSQFVKEEKVRGRQETRVCKVITDKKILAGFCEKYPWPDLKTIAVVSYYRKDKEKRVVKQIPQKDGSWKWMKVNDEYRELSEQKFYLSSRLSTAEELMERARSHWHLENKLNWHLDVTLQ
jgi:predicted transposase YbfD/YdcC